MTTERRNEEEEMPTQDKSESRELVHWNPWQEVFPWNTRLGQLLESGWHTHSGQVAPGAELEEADDAFVLELDLPGVAKDDVTIDVTGRRVSVHGTRTEKERTGVLRHSTRTTGTFDYEVTLPTPVDDKAVTATLDGGVLTVRLPKASDAKTTRIAIK